MKKIALAVCCLTLAGCGTWSNEDLEFLNAMPEKKDMIAKLPGATSGGLRGEGTRRDPLIDPVVGATSELYTTTKGVSTSFNGFLNFLDILEAVRAYPPTTRAQNSRIWGPWTDDNNPKFEVRVVVTKASAERFEYAFQHRPKGGEYFDTVTGFFKPTATLRKGSGELHFHVGDVAAKGLVLDPGFAKLQKIDISYITDMFPVTVAMKFEGRPGEALETVDYGYQENKDTSGTMGFIAKTTDPNTLKLDVGSSWLASGAGYGVLTVVEGNYRGATQLDCWDAAFKIVYAKQTWPGGKEVGDPTKCVAVENGAPKP